MRTEVSFQNYNEKEKKKIFGSISPQNLLFDQGHSYQKWFKYKPKHASVVLVSITLKRKLPKGSKMKGGVYEVAFRKIKIVKSWSQKVKSQDQSVKLALIEFTC